MTQKDTLPILSFADQQAWEEWIAANLADSIGVWLKIAKKDSGIPSVDYAQALESALCYGWIDGQKNAFDERYWLQKFTPRRPKSKWSRINRDKAQALIETGRMQPAGLRQVQLAQADGRWEAAYESQSKIEVPPDFQAALDANLPAQEFFQTLNGANRYAILYRIHTAVKPETRAARIAKFIQMLAERNTLYP